MSTLTLATLSLLWHANDRRKMADNDRQSNKIRSNIPSWAQVDILQQLREQVLHEEGLIPGDLRYQEKTGN